MQSPKRKTSLNRPEKILAFAAVAEIGTGFVLLIDPAVIATLLLGTELTDIAIPVARVAGIALIGLGVACWPGWQRTESNSSALLAMLTYSVLIALYLAYLGTVGHLGGVLLWPGVVLHSVVALLLARAWCATEVTSHRP